MSMSMSKITDCEVAECSYNSDKKCHTIAITVGDSNCPMCDTFVKMGKKGGDPDTIGGVGACRAEACRYNASLECSAGSIHVGMHGGHADCMTFSAK